MNFLFLSYLLTSILKAKSCGWVVSTKSSSPSKLEVMGIFLFKEGGGPRAKDGKKILLHDGGVMFLQNGGGRTLLLLIHS